MWYESDGNVQSGTKFVVQQILSVLRYFIVDKEKKASSQTGVISFVVSCFTLR